MDEQRVQRRMSGSPEVPSFAPTDGSQPSEERGVFERASRALASHWGVLIVFPGLVLALGVFLVWMAQDALRGSNLELAEARMRDQARMVSEHLGLALGQADTILTDLGSFAATIDSNTDPKDVAPALRKLIDGRPGASYISLSFPDGVFMGAFVDEGGALRFQVSRLLEGLTEKRVFDFGPRETLIEREVHRSRYDPRERPFYQLALKAKKKVWTDPYTFAGSGETGITLTEAIWLEPGATGEHAVLTVDFDVRSLSPLLRRAENLSERPLLYNAQGTILADPQIDLLKGRINQGAAAGEAQLLNYRALGDTVLSSFFERLPKEDVEGFFTFATPDGNQLAAVAPLRKLEGLDWSVAFIAPEASFLASLKNYTRRSYLFAALALLLAAIASTAYARLVVRVRKEASLARAAARLARKEARELGSYRLVGRLGAGGMGEVWRAQHRLLAREAAIKLIKTEGSSGDPRVAQERFRREAQSLASLRSRNTIEIFDYGVTEDGTFFYVMELLDGLDLETLVLRDGPQPASRVVKLLIQACRSLAEAHEAGLVHRDVKPANIFVCRVADELDVVKVLDFGLVRTLDVETTGGNTGSDPEEQSSPVLTHAGNVMGTPAFMAPEQIMGADVDGRADLYALGCVAFWLLSGKPVFERPHQIAMMSAHLTQSPPSLADICAEPPPAALMDLVESCLAKSPDDRPKSAHDLMRALQSIEAQIGAEWDSQLEEWWNHHERDRAPEPNHGGEVALAQTMIFHAKVRQENIA